MTVRRVSAAQFRSAINRAQQQLRQAERQLRTSASDARRVEQQLRQAINRMR